MDHKRKRFSQSDLIDRANARADKAERDRAEAFKRRADLLIQRRKEREEMHRKYDALRLELAIAKMKLVQSTAELEMATRGLEKTTKQLAEAKKELEQTTKQLADTRIELEKEKQHRELETRMVQLFIKQNTDLRIELADAKKSEDGSEEKAEEPTAATTTTKKKLDLNHPRMKSCSGDLVKTIEMEIIDNSAVTLDDIAGLQFAKKCVNELIIWPMSRPDVFTGLRTLPKGTGKTLIGKAIANQSGATFFSISASSIMSKWAGESEKLVRTLFAVAAAMQPSVIFIDEIDSMLTRRNETDSEVRRAVKTEFLVQLDGVGTESKDTVLVIGATNCPQMLDEAARRRFVKRLYIPLPSSEARSDLVKHLPKDNQNELTPEDVKLIADATEGFSCADMKELCTEAALGPIRSCPDIRVMKAEDIRPIHYSDFADALNGVRSSVAKKDLAMYTEWNDQFGSFH